MKKTLSLLLLVLLAGVVNAQKAQFGIRMRYTTAKMSLTQGYLTSTSGSLDNVDIGVFTERNYGDFSLQPGLSLVMKGGSGGGGTIFGAGSFSTYGSTLTFIDLELPINVLYNIKLKPGKIFIGGGPYIGYALSGKAKLYYSSYDNNGNFLGNDTATQKVSFTSDPNDFKRFDVGLNALAGFRLNNGLEFNLGLGAGLTSITNDANTKINNRTLSAGLGYFF